MKFLTKKILIHITRRYKKLKKLKVITVVGTRPEIIRLSRVISKLEKNCRHILVHTGQNYDYELNEIFFRDLEIKKPNYFLNSASGDSAGTIGNIIANIDQILIKEKPEAVLILGDTNSCLSIIAAKRRKIPTFHMEAGNRCFDFRVPEEINRRIVDHVADINLTYSSLARQHLLNEGLNTDMIIKTGSPMKEVLEYNLNNIQNSNILKKLKLENQRYFVVSFHREENVENRSNILAFEKILNQISIKFKMPIIVSTHPRTKRALKKANAKFKKNISFLKPLGFHDYLKLQVNSYVTLSDSGTISEESSILNFPALNLRETHERHEAMDEASVIMTGLKLENVMRSINLLENQRKSNERILKIPDDYDISNVSEKVVRIIHSYIDYVNRKIWFK